MPTSKEPVRRTPARTGETAVRPGFKSRRNVDPLTKDVIALDQYVAEVDADAPFHSAVAGQPAFRSVVSLCSAIAHWTAPTAEPNSIRTPSQVVLTIRPPCWAISGSTAA